MKPLLVTLLLLVLGSAALAAQVRTVRRGDDRLVGIRELDVLIKSRSANTPACRLTVDAAQQRVVQVFRDRGLRATISEKAPSSPYSLVVDLPSERTSTGCATAVITELVADVTAIPDADASRQPGEWGSLLIGPMTLTRETALVIGSPVEHDAAVQHAILAQVTMVAARIRTANP
jgi:hypothetical protein